MKKLFCLLLIAAPALFGQANSALVPNPKTFWNDVNGHPLAGGMLYFYAAGTTNPQNTYSDAGLTSANQNPVILDSAGRATIYLQALSYKVVATSSTGASQWTQDNVFDLAQLLQANLIGTGTGKGANLIGYLPPGAGGVPSNVQATLNNVVYASSYGAVCDGSTDDYNAFHAAVTYAASLGHTPNLGGHVRFRNYCAMSKALDLPANVTVEGDNVNSSGLVVLSSASYSHYTASNGALLTYAFSEGGNGTTPLEGSQFAHLSLICNNLVQTCFQSTSAQENSGLHDVLITGSLNYGIDLVGYQVQNSDWNNLTIFAGSAAVAGWHGAHFYECNSRCSIRDVTINGYFSSTALTSSALLFEGGSHGSIVNVHCEEIRVCVENQDSFAVVDSVALNNGNPSNAIAILNHGSSALSAHNTTKNGPTYATQITICDQTQTGTSTCGYGSGVSGVLMPNEIIEAAYESEWNSLGGTTTRNVLSTNQYIFSMIKLFTTSYLQLPNIGALTNDTGGGILLTEINSNTAGLMFQNANLTPGFSSGGLHLNGGGYTGHADGAMGSVCGGGKYDSGTLVYEVSSYGCISFRDGAVELFGAAGLTPGGTTSNPAKQLVVSSAGARIVPSATNPGCNSNVPGLVWVNTSASPARFEYCDGTNWYYGTVNTGP